MALTVLHITYLQRTSGELFYDQLGFSNVLLEDVWKYGEREKFKQVCVASAES